MNERQKLMEKVQMYSFALVDIALYLDTHPKDAAALSQYRQTKMLYEQAMKEYSSKFGPLDQMSANDTTAWNWIDNPWPWEYEAR